MSKWVIVPCLCDLNIFRTHQYLSHADRHPTLVRPHTLAHRPHNFISGSSLLRSIEPARVEYACWARTRHRSILAQSALGAAVSAES